MPPRTTSKGKAVKAKKVSGKPKRGTARKAPAKLTYEDMQNFLQQMKEWWTTLGGDVKAVEALIKKLPAKQPLSADAKRELGKLVKRIEREMSCPFPTHIQNICV